MAEIRVHLAGAFSISSGDRWLASSDLRSRQARAVLAFLVLSRARRVSSEEIREVLWGDSWPPAWNIGVRALLSQIRHSLNRLAGHDSVIRLSTHHGTHRVSLPPDALVDIEEAVTALERAEHAIQSGRARDAHADASTAAIILRRPFLPEISSRWAESQRTRQRRLLRRSLECLAESWLALSQPAPAVEAASEAVAIDHTSEVAYRVLIRANLASANPAEAVRCYHRLREALVSELGIDPSSETEALFLSVLRPSQ